MSENEAVPNLVVVSFFAGLRSRGIELHLSGTKVSWPATCELTPGELVVLKKYRTAIREHIRANSSAVPVSPAGSAVSEAVGAPAPKAIAPGPDPNVAPGDDAVQSILVVPHLDASGKLDATAKADEKLRLANPTLWRMLHPDHPDVIAEDNAAATRVMYITHDVPSRWL